MKALKMLDVADAAVLTVNLAAGVACLIGWAHGGYKHVITPIGAAINFAVAAFCAYQMRKRNERLKHQDALARAISHWTGMRHHMAVEAAEAPEIARAAQQRGLLFPRAPLPVPRPDRPRQLQPGIAAALGGDAAMIQALLGAQHIPPGVAAPPAQENPQ